MRILILYASVEGQTAKIAQFVQSCIERTEYKVSLHDLGANVAPLDFQEYEKVIIAAPIHRQKHPLIIENLLRANQGLFEKLQTLFLSVSLCAAFLEGQMEATSYVDNLEKRTGFSANKTTLVAGALQFEKYHKYESQVVRLIGLHLNNYTAVSRDREFTDWQSLERTVLDFLNS